MRKWLIPLVDRYLAAVIHLKEDDATTAQQWADWMKEQWANHGLEQLPQQRNLMTEVRRTIRETLGVDHVAFQTMDFSTEEWIAINRPTVQAAARQSSQQVILSPATIDRVVARATELLAAREWAEVAAGIVVLSGRRSTEVLKTGEFQLKSPYSVTFTGALKRRGEEKTLVFEVPTLAPAQMLIEALSKLRSVLPATQLSAYEVNQRFSHQVAIACDRHFSELVPPVTGKENLYTHLFRKLYATIATYFYCPTTVDEAEFRAEIQGHFSSHENLSLAERRTIASDRHYRGYAIQAADGAIHKGIRLGWPDVQVLDAFNLDLQEMEFMPSKKDRTARKLSSLRVFADERDRWIDAMNQVYPEGVSQQVRLSALLSWIEERLTAGMSEPAVVNYPDNSDTVAHQAKTLAWLTAEVDNLRDQVVTLHQKQVTITTDEGELQATNAALKAEVLQLRQEQERLQPLLNLLQGVQAAVPAVPPTQPQTLVVTTPTIDRTPSARPASTRSGIAAGVVDPDIVDVVRAIFAYNDSPGRTHHEKWAIGFNPMKELCTLIGKSSQPKIAAVLKAMEQDISEHMSAHMLGSRHNRVHEGKSIADFVEIHR